MSKNQRGFTLVELLLATAFFGFILIFVTAGFVQISRSYNKGITVKRVQETTRQIVEEISRTMLSATSSEYAGSGLQKNDNAGSRRLCVGGTRFAWNQYGDTVPPENMFNLVRDYKGGNDCFGALNESESVELVDSRLAVQDITITEIGATSGIYRLCVIISTNSNSSDIDTSGTPESGCEVNVTCNIMNGDQFCDVAKLKTVVTLRN